MHKLLPHCRKENKLDSKSKLFLLNEIADMHGCNYTLYLENRKKEDLYLWFAKVPEGPSMKFYVQNGKLSLSLSSTPLTLHVVPTLLSQ